MILSPDVRFVVETIDQWRSAAEGYLAGRGEGAWSWRRYGSGAPYYRAQRETTNRRVTGLPVWRYDYEP